MLGRFYVQPLLIKRSIDVMLKMTEMDEGVTLAKQLDEKDELPVILINKFNVKPEDADNLLKAWAADAAYLKQKPGFISAQLHRGIAGSCVFINYAVWESVERFKQATNDPEFKSALAHYPDSTVASPHLFRKVAVPGICVD
jgi:heme-degrading monooxygenase HmoA